MGTFTTVTGVSGSGKSSHVSQFLLQLVGDALGTDQLRDPLPDEPTAGLHPADIERLLRQLHALVDAGNTVVVVEHDMHVAASSDWVIELGPGAGADGGRILRVVRRV